MLILGNDKASHTGFRETNLRACYTKGASESTANAYPAFYPSQARDMSGDVGIREIRAMRSLSLGVCLVVLAAGVGEAQVRVPIAAPVIAVAPGAIAPGSVVGGRMVESTSVDPSCLVTRGSNLSTTALLIVPHTRIGEYAAVFTPAFGRCARPQNPYPARLVVFTHVTQDGAGTVYRNGTLACRFALGDPNTAVCNRPLRCDLAFHRCANP